MESGSLSRHIPGTGMRKDCGTELQSIISTSNVPRLNVVQCIYIQGICSVD